MDIQLVKRIANPNNKPIPKKAQPIEELEQLTKDTDAQLTPQPTVDATVPPRGTVKQQPSFILMILTTSAIALVFPWVTPGGNHQTFGEISGLIVFMIEDAPPSMPVHLPRTNGF